MEPLRLIIHKDGMAALLLQDLENKLGANKVCIVLVLSALTVLVGLLLTYFRFGFSFLFNVACFVYPTWMSLRALRSPENTRELTKWLTFWPLLYLINPVTSAYEFSRWSVFRCLFLAWCMLSDSSWNGSLVIYNYLVHPIQLLFLRIVDSRLESLQRDRPYRTAVKSTKGLSQEPVTPWLGKTNENGGMRNNASKLPASRIPKASIEVSCKPTKYNSSIFRTTQPKGKN